MNLYAVIVAGGQGSRMKSNIPKQFLELNGKPILLRTIEAFYQYRNDIRIILVLPESQMNHWKKMIDVYDIKIKHELVKGGKSRFDSVRNGLASIKEGGIVSIHDGVRPLVTQSIIGNGYGLAAEKSNAITTVDLKDSIRKISNGANVSVDRSEYKIVQTPQTFDVELIQRAYQQPYQECFTDDASVLESLGEKIHLVSGEYDNIKITTPEDLIIAAEVLSKRENA